MNHGNNGKPTHLISSRDLDVPYCRPIAISYINKMGEEALKPFVLCSVKEASLKDEQARVESILSNEGFQVVGTAVPYADTSIICVTNDLIRKLAGESSHGAFGAVVRVSVTSVKDQVQVSFSNPVYYSAAYRMKADQYWNELSKKLKSCLGFVGQFGATKTLTDAKLRKYHYKLGMPYFSEPLVLGKFKTYEEAVASVEKGLSNECGGCRKVFGVEIPGKEETVFGVTFCKEWSDGRVMKEIDVDDEYRRSAHLPYELVVTQNKAIALSPKFRIAISFPDLAMVGKHSFANIMSCPTAIEKSLSAAATAKCVE